MRSHHPSVIFARRKPQRRSYIFKVQILLYVTRIFDYKFATIRYQRKWGAR